MEPRRERPRAPKRPPPKEWLCRRWLGGPASAEWVQDGDTAVVRAEKVASTHPAHVPQFPHSARSWLGLFGARQSIGWPPKGPLSPQPCTHWVLQPSPPSHQEPPSAAATLDEATRCSGGTSPLSKALVWGIRGASVPPTTSAPGRLVPRHPWDTSKERQHPLQGPPTLAEPPQPSSSSISPTLPCLMGGGWHSKQCPPSPSV